MPEKGRILQKSLILLLLIALLLGLFVVSLIVDRTVQFSDPNLELEIRRLLNNYSKPIYQSQLLSFIELDLSGEQIADLSGLEHFRNLEVLNLENNFVEDLSPLQTLTNLTVLNLSNNGVSTLESVQFDVLTHLNLVELTLNSYEVLSSVGRKNEVSNLQILSQFQELQVLELHGNLIREVSPISNLNKLRILDLGENLIQDITPLAGLVVLEEANLSRNHIRDLSALSSLTNLNKVSDKMKLNFEIKGETAEIEIDPRVFPKRIVMRTAYKYINRAWISVEKSDDSKKVLVSLYPREESRRNQEELKDMCLKFNTDLIEVIPNVVIRNS